MVSVVEALERVSAQEQARVVEQVRPLVGHTA
jgi:hypothetical protein